MVNVDDQKKPRIVAQEGEFSNLKLNGIHEFTFVLHFFMAITYITFRKT